METSKILSYKIHENKQADGEKKNILTPVL